MIFAEPLFLFPENLFPSHFFPLKAVSPLKYLFNEVILCKSVSVSLIPLFYIASDIYERERGGGSRARPARYKKIWRRSSGVCSFSPREGGVSLSVAAVGFVLRTYVPYIAPPLQNNSLFIFRSALPGMISTLFRPDRRTKRAPPAGLVRCV